MNAYRADCLQQQSLRGLGNVSVKPLPPVLFRYKAYVLPTRKIVCGWLEPEVHISGVIERQGREQGKHCRLRVIERQPAGAHSKEWTDRLLIAPARNHRDRVDYVLLR